MSITELGANAAADSGSGGGDDNDGGSGSEYERFDLSDVAFGMQHPTTAVRGEAVALRKLWDDDDPDRADIAVILDDPTIVTSEEDLAGTVVAQSDEENDDFKVVNLDDGDTAALGPGGKIDDRDDIDDLSDLMGVDFDSNTFYADVLDDFDEDRQIALKRGGGAGSRIAKVLDVNGGTGAEALVERDEDGALVDIELDDSGFPAHNGGYLEYTPDDSDIDEPPRQSRDPQLRPDAEGHEVVIMVQRLADIQPDYSGRAYWATVFANMDDDRMDELAEQYADGSDASPEDFITELGGDEFIRLDTTTAFEPDEDLVDDTGWVEWTGIDRSDASEVRFLNEKRIDADFDSIYVPSGFDVADVCPDGVDASEVLTDASDDEWADDSLIKAFGAGV